MVCEVFQRIPSGADTSPDQVGLETCKGSGMIYAYRCPECEEVYELRYRMGEQPERIHCPECSGVAERMYYAIQFSMN